MNRPTASLPAVLNEHGKDLAADPLIDVMPSYDELVRVNNARYRTGHHGLSTIKEAIPPRADLVAQREAWSAVLPSDATAITVLATMVASMFGTLMGTAALLVNGMAPALLALTAFASIVLVTSTALNSRDGRRHDERRRLDAAIGESKAATVPTAAAFAYRRLRSAVKEVDDEDRDHDREARATVRLAEEGGREIVRLLDHHREAGTLDSPTARSLTVEIYRLASEVDAYLTLHNAHRFAPGEDAALSVLGSTSQLSLAPGTDEAEEEQG